MCEGKCVDRVNMTIHNRWSTGCVNNHGRRNKYSLTCAYTLFSQGFVFVRNTVRCEA